MAEYGRWVPGSAVGMWSQELPPATLREAAADAPARLTIALEGAEFVLRGRGAGALGSYPTPGAAQEAGQALLDGLRASSVADMLKAAGLEPGDWGVLDEDGVVVEHAGSGARFESSWGTEWNAFDGDDQHIGTHDTAEAAAACVLAYLLAGEVDAPAP